MTGVIFAETIRRHWKQVIYWGLALAFFALYAALLTPNMETAQAYVQLLESMPGGLLQMFGVEDAASIVSAEGFIGFAYFLYGLIMLAVYAVIVGQDITAADEDRGVMDMVLSLPVPRWQVVIEKALAYTVTLAALVGIGLVALLVGVSANEHASDVTAVELISGSINLLVNGLLVMMVTAFLGVLVRRKGTAVALAGAFVGFSYLVDAIARLANSEAADTIANLSFFRLYDGANMLYNGINWINVGAVAIAVIVFLLATIRLFQRRDIAV